MAIQAKPSPAKQEPTRVGVFIDGFNLFSWVKRCFGYKHPNYDIKKLAESVVTMEEGRQVASINFYIGIPSKIDDAINNAWWTRKLAAMGRLGVNIVTRPLKRRELTIKLSGIVYFEKTVPRLIEKGIDLKLGLDMVRLARNREYDVAILFSQDGDLAEAVEEVKRVGREQERQIQIECAYPIAAGINSYPIRRTVPRQITKTQYDTCIDPTDYRRL